MSELKPETRIGAQALHPIESTHNAIAAKPISLDWPHAEFQALLHETCNTVLRLYDNLDSKAVYHPLDPNTIQRLIFEPLPAAGADMRKILRDVENKIFATATLNISPRYFAYVISSGTQAGILAGLLEAALNQNVTKWHMGPSAAELEKQVIQWIMTFIGYDAADGILVSGGSAANQVCLSAALTAQAPIDVTQKGLFSSPKLVAYISNQGHSCFDKAFSQMGLGREQLRKIPVTPKFTIDTTLLEKAIRLDKQAGLYPFCIIANGGTVNTGAVDPLARLGTLARKYGLWFHVDCAYGGPAAVSDIAAPLFTGLDQADSVALDPHKWLYVPFEAGCALVKRQSALKNTFTYQAEYLKTTNKSEHQTDFMNYSPQLSRNFKALKVWMTFKAYGADSIKYAIEQNILIMQEFSILITESDDFEMLAPAPLSIVCFRYITAGKEVHGNEQYLSQLNDQIVEELEREGRFFISKTTLANKTALRACCVNHRTTRQDIKDLINAIRDIGTRLRKQAQLNGFN